ncbi:MAG: type III polyketide synthase [Ardenticatenales bacterium]
MGTTTRLYGLGIATPPHHSPQAAVGAFMARVVAAEAERTAAEAVLAARSTSPVAEPASAARRPVRSARLIRRLYAESGIERRFSILADYTKVDPDGFCFFPPNWALHPFPTTADRMAVYREASVDLAAEAARAALAEAGIAPGDVTHLVISTCTGFFAPGPDVMLVRRLGLAPTVQRTVIGFMGCNAGFNGLRNAGAIVGADEGAVVLQVCVELCSLHFQRDDASETLIANCLFSDGASAAIWAADGRFPGGHGTLRGTHSRIHDDSLDQMGWRIGDHGFVMTLSDAVPDTLSEAIGPFVDVLLAGSGSARARVAGWAIHPGGKRIVEGLGRALALSDAQLSSAFGVLRDYGNMSSATILFVIQRELARLRAAGEEGGAAGGDDGGDVVALGFGPGLSIEGAVLRVDR